MNPSRPPPHPLGGSSKSLEFTRKWRRLTLCYGSFPLLRRTPLLLLLPYHDPFCRVLNMGNYYSFTTVADRQEHSPASIGEAHVCTFAPSILDEIAVGTIIADRPPVPLFVPMRFREQPQQGQIVQRQRKCEEFSSGSPLPMSWAVHNFNLAFHCHLTQRRALCREWATLSSVR